MSDAPSHRPHDAPLVPLLLLALVCLAFPLVAAPPKSADIDRLIQQLASPDQAERAAAVKGLEAIGEPALEPLRKAAASQADVDVRLRLRVVVRAIETKLYGERLRLQGHDGQVQCVAFSLDGKLALTGGIDRTLRLWDLETGKEVRKFEGHTGGVWGVSFSPDGKRILSAGGGTDRDGEWNPAADRSVRLWETATGKELRRFEGHTDQVLHVAFAPDGRTAVSGGQDRSLRLWDLETGKELRKFEGHTSGISGLAFSPDGLRIISSSHDQTLRLWETATGKELRKFEAHDGWVMSVALSPDGRQALSGGADRTLRLWDVETGKELRRFEGHATMVCRVAFTPDGKRALSGAGCKMLGTNRYVPAGSDYGLRLWDIETGKALYLFEEHGGPVLAVAVSADGRRALSGAGDGTARLWAIPR